MKRRVLSLGASLFLTLVLVALLMAACAGPAPTPTQTPSPTQAPTPVQTPKATTTAAPASPATTAAAKQYPQLKSGVAMPTFVTIMGGGSATSGNTLAAKAIEKSILQHFPSIASRVELGTTPKALARIEEKSADIGIGGEANIADIVSGKIDPFKKLTNVQILGQFSQGSYFLWVTTADSPINKINDFVGRRISVGAAGTATESTAELILKAYGLDFKRIESAGGLVYRTPSWPEAVEMLVGGQLDAVALYTQHPEPTAMGLARGRRGMKIIPMEEGIKKVLAEMPGMVPVLVPGGDYPGQGPHETFDIVMRIVGRADISEDAMYNLVAAAWWNDAAALKSISPAWERLDQLKVAVGLEPEAVKWHPGAKKFWWELWKMRGLLK